MAIKPKQWLFDNGHIEVIGRGRMSQAHKDLIAEAVRDGVDIEGYAKVEKPSMSTDKPTAVERVKVDPNRVLDVPDVSRDERKVMAYRLDAGKVVEIGMRTVDIVCGNSLTYCRCESPRVWVDHERQCVVNFRTRN